MDSAFITNQQEFLSKVIKDILPVSEKLYFLVGYFYFSGFEEIYTQLEDKELKILVGMNIERDISNHIKEFYILREAEQSRLEIKKQYYSSLVDVFNNTDFFDSAARIKAFELFLKKIQDGSLQIKKTAVPNHAKMYLFEHSPWYAQGGKLPGTMITGSSNLSLSGLKSQHEINVILYDKFKAGKAIFDSLWDTAVDIISLDNLEDFTELVIKKIWYQKLYSPYLFYVRVLDEFFSIKDHRRVSLPSHITDGAFFDLKYQTDAIKKALKVIEEHSGVMICDVVGLGKSIIASAVAYNLHKKVIIIAPPHLKDQWDKDYRVRFELNAVVFGSGSIHKALAYQANFPDEEFVIIVDEAHKYRNEYTDDYILLHRLCQGNKVMLLTATPFNNRPQDVFAMIKLFQIPSKSTIRSVDNLSYHFAEAVKEYKEINSRRNKKTISKNELERRVNELARKIRFILDPVVIRRSRLDLEKIASYRADLQKQGIRYVFAEPPILKEYSLGDLAGRYMKTLKLISQNSKDISADSGEINADTGYIGARYKPANYIIDLEKFKNNITNENADVESIGIAQTNLANFMQKLLVGRFESSLNAFKKTLESMINSMQIIKGYYTKLGKVPIYKKGKLPSADELLEDLDDDTMAQINSYAFEEELKKHYEKGLVFIPKDDLKASFIIHLEHDLELLGKIHQEWFAKGIAKDPKLESFKHEIKRQLSEDPSRKIVMFSEYTDTASYVYDRISQDPQIRALYYSSQESAKIRRIIKANFDASASNQKDDYDIIISTDALSEGINLNRAGTVFNYDIPYNPTRVIQRVGRINRIGRMLFDKLYIYNYFPTDIGEGHIRKKEISTLKKAMIDVLLGEDTKVLTNEEKLVSYYHEQYQKALANQEAESWDAKFINEYDQIRSGKVDLLKKARAMEHRSRLRRNVQKEQSGVLVFGKKGDDFSFRLGEDAQKSYALTPEEALNLFKASQLEKPRAVSAAFDAIYQNVKANMYVSQSITATSGKRAEYLNKIKAMIKEETPYKDYLQDLFTVAKDLDSLPDGAYLAIKDVRKDSLNDDIQKLMELIPHRYLNTIINNARKIEEGAESLILAEELI